MTDINADEHRPHVGHGVWELHPVEVSPSLTIYLPQDVGRLGHVEGPAVATRDHLRRHLVHVANLLDHFVVGLPVEDADCDLGVSESRVTVPHHVVEQPLLQLSCVVLALQLDQSRVLNSNLEHGTRLLEGGHYLACNVTEVPSADDNPLVSHQVNCLLDWQAAKDLLVDVDHFILAENLGRSQHCALNRVRHTVQPQSPLLDAPLLLQILEDSLDACHLLLWGKLRLHESVAHTWALSDAVRHPVQDGELWGQVQEVIGHLDHEKRLSEVGDPQLIHLLEVLGDRNFHPVVWKLK